VSSGNFARDARHFTSPALMPHSHSTELRVRYAETDRMGIVYYANYLIWCEVGRVEFMRALGRGYASLEAEGTGLAVSEAMVRYLAPARFDDLVRVETTLTGVRSRAVTFDYVITHAESGTRLATAHTALVSIAPDGRLTALPAHFRAALEAVL
jgi:acyl-CoA thioester hydrolase